MTVFLSAPNGAARARGPAEIPAVAEMPVAAEVPTAAQITNQAAASQAAAADQAANQAAAQTAEAAAARTAALAAAALAAVLGRRAHAGPTPGTDDWHADRPAVVAAGARAGVKEKMAARARHRAELPGQVVLLQQMQQRGREVCAELERRSRGRSGSWWGSEKSEQIEQLKEQEAEEMQQLTEELQALKVQVAAVHPKVTG